MPRYIDAEKLIQRLEREVESCKDPSKGSALGFKMAILIVQTFRWQEDVVPRAEVERLEQILNSYALQYGTVKDQQEVIDKIKRETSREIFADIQEECFDQFGYFDFDAFAQIKKKYTEGEK